MFCSFYTTRMEMIDKNKMKETQNENENFNKMISNELIVCLYEQYEKT